MRNKATTATTFRRTKRATCFGIALISTLVFTLLAVPVTFADGGREILLQDKCDPATFNAFAGDTICFKPGGVTIDEFLAKLNLQDGGHHAWRFSRKELGIKAGEVVHVTNSGGEVHSFTEVIAFGTDSIVPALNAAIPETTPAVPVLPDPSPTFLFPGASLDVSGLSPGTHNFQCLIHPWMRSVVTVTSH